jgi:PDZ domain-containing protein
LSYKKIFDFNLIFGWLALLCFGFPGLTQSAFLNIRIQDSLIYLHADQVSLIHVLKNITEKADILFESSDPLTKPVSLDLEGISIEKCVRRLLANHNYSLSFKKTEDSHFVITSVQVLGHASGSGFKPTSKPGSVARTHAEVRPLSDPPPQIESESHTVSEDPFQRYETDRFKQAFENTDMLSEEIAIAEPERPALPEGAPVPEGLSRIPIPKETHHLEGIRIKEVVTSSVFAQIGLREGDVIQNVNGKQVATKREFIEALQKVPEEQPMVRIARVTENGMMDPIYLKLQGAKEESGNSPPQVKELGAGNKQETQ